MNAWCTGVAAVSLMASLGILVPAAMAAGHMGMGQSRCGGPVYNGAPALVVTASLVQAGGGPGHWSTARALTSMVGSKLARSEVARLTGQYSKDRVQSWLSIFDFAVNDALKMATGAGIKLPPATLHGKRLATALVKSGLDTDGTFYTEFLLDKALSHRIHEKTMEDIDARFGAQSNADYHRISNQAFYDLAQALGAKSVKLPIFH